MSDTSDAKIASLVAAIRETASRMEGLSMQMQDFSGEPEIQAHGFEMADAVLIAETWANGIERDNGLRPVSEIAPVIPEVTHAMGVHMGGIGDKVMNFIIDSQLLSTECPACPDEGTLTVWSANAAEQIEAFIAGLARQGTVPCPFCGQSQNSSDLETIMRAKDLYRRFRKYHPDSLDVLEEMIKDGELSQPREPNL